MTQHSTTVAADFQLEPYLHFNGTCEAALNFYVEVFGGEISAMMRFGDVTSQGPVPAGQEQKVMHSSFQSPSLKFMAADNRPGTIGGTDSNVSLSLSTRNVPAAQRVFAMLSEGGNVSMPMQNTFWGALFGMVTDKYGIEWMINAEQTQS